ncbi:MAG TPA: hypothetical protein VGM37_17120 [Armatimonadota bacterium]|jgi:hypothetical protein
MTDVIRLSRQEGGWVVSGEDAPIGYIANDGSVITPSGARYAIADGKLTSADGRVAAALDAGGVTDAATHTRWELRPGWTASFTDGELALHEAFAREYSLEDAQDTVPARVKLLLASVIVRDQG